MFSFARRGAKLRTTLLRSRSAAGLSSQPMIRDGLQKLRTRRSGMRVAALTGSKRCCGEGQTGSNSRESRTTSARSASTRSMTSRRDVRQASRERFSSRRDRDQCGMVQQHLPTVIRRRASSACCTAPESKRMDFSTVLQRIQRSNRRSVWRRAPHHRGFTSARARDFRGHTTRAATTVTARIRHRSEDSIARQPA